MTRPVIASPPAASPEDLPLGADELGDERLGRLARRARERPALDDPAVAHQDDLVAEPAGLGEVVGDHDDRLLERAEDGAQVGLQLGADHRVERASGSSSRITCGSSISARIRLDALPLAAGELRREAVEPVGRETRQLGELGEPVVDPAALPAQVAGHQDHVVARGQVREQAAVLDDVPRPRRTSSTVAGVSSVPAIVTEPASGRTRPIIRRSSVDLPQPLGPISTVVRPGAIVRSSSGARLGRHTTWKPLQNSIIRRDLSRARGIVILVRLVAERSASLAVRPDRL